ncbi:cysteine-rich secretory protein LCCL domain-containing 2 [Brienomyrus brachyistius]|uniref:cysteine-rich secretory protein LCCL domain-containing 2 n=1 Tax=Brienomyrus brachyistius TaxID=42636 RepID=UPI0020B2C11A|nr:cysteine-rich secretory protein LCCL domain-containing 2 [Brienomyrus brachyistius]XP_048887473.1 cysteine-rich secretory protein LCCL domain-containing 2 [Brienomyrus brachyistius]
MNIAVTCFAALVLLALVTSDGAALYLPDSPELQRLMSRYQEEMELNHTAPSRSRRAIPWSDREEILKLHNKLRGEVYPTASNMEYMVWDEELERSATYWAEECIWDHGPQDLLMSIGQNLAVHWGRYRSPAYHVQAWYDEVKDYTYPYPHECNPWCPERCSGPMCTHYTQLVWATTSRVGCAVHICPAMNVWGEIWENAVYLVCNYSPKGNWIGEAPYQHGRPCSQCPPSYGGVCRDNLCYKEDAQVPQQPETEDMNEVERPQVPVQDRTTTTKPAPRPPPKPSAPKKTPSSKSASTTYLAQKIKCETKMRDKCRGATCNRYQCPANCLRSKAKVWGTLFYDVQSSICRAAIHSGAIDNNGGLVDITRKDNLPFFVKATKNEIESLSKYKPGNAFVVARVERQSIDCYATVAEICPFGKTTTNCPRVLCPDGCKDQPSYWAPVFGNNIYLDSSSICRAAIHAGAIKASGGYVDILALANKKTYMGTLKNGIQSESKRNMEGNSFRVFAVRE